MDCYKAKTYRLTALLLQRNGLEKEHEGNCLILQDAELPGFPLGALPCSAAAAAWCVLRDEFFFKRQEAIRDGMGCCSLSTAPATPPFTLPRVISSLRGFFQHREPLTVLRQEQDSPLAPIPERQNHNKRCFLYSQDEHSKRRNLALKSPKGTWVHALDSGISQHGVVGCSKILCTVPAVCEMELKRPARIQLQTSSLCLVPPAMQMGHCTPSPNPS